MARLNGSWSSSSASISWSNSVSTSPRRSGTLAIVRTPGPGGMRTQRSGAMTPRRAACARSKRDVCVGKRSVTWRAISAPVAVMPTNTGLVPVADRGRRLLAERGVRLVADDDRVRVGDVARVAHEPLVGLDRHRAVGAVLPAQQRRGDALAVAAVAQLAEELVDEVAPVGEDQRAAGARALDEAERGDRLAGAGRVLEPEALAGVGVLRRAGSCVVVVLGVGLVVPVLRLLRLVVVLASRSSSPGMPGRGQRRVGAAGPRRRPFGAVARAASASSAVSVPDSASTWWAESTVPSTSFGSSWREQPVQARAAATSAGARRPTGPSRRRRARRARRRARRGARVPGASCDGGLLPSSTNGSRVNAAARSIASGRRMAGAASRATDVGSAIRLGAIRGVGAANGTAARLRGFAGRDPGPGLQKGPEASVGPREAFH